MGIKEDGVYLKGSEYERKLYELKQGLIMMLFLVECDDGQWRFQNIRPKMGRAYVERLPDGSCRKYSNRDDADTFYQLV